MSIVVIVLARLRPNPFVYPLTVTDGVPAADTRNAASHAVMFLTVKLSSAFAKGVLK